MDINYNLFPVGDGTLYAQNQTSTAHTEIRISSVFSPAAYNRGWLLFDLSGLPAGKIVSTAVLTLIRSAVTFSSSTVDSPTYELTELPTEGEASWLKRNSVTNWTKPGGTYDNNSPIYLAPTGTGNYTLNLIDTVRIWYSDTSINRGIIIEGGAGGTEITYYSREAADAANRPVLSITLSDAGGRYKPVDWAGGFNS